MNAGGDSFEFARAIIELSEQELTLTEGDQVQLAAYVVPEDAGKVYWKSNTPDVAGVSSDGLVTAVSEGTATITAEVAGVQATCSVTVTKPYEYVDLGLSVKWATMNVGAHAPEEYGDYFAWGETEPKSTYSWETYKWCNGSETTMTKYCTKSDYGTIDNKTVLELSDDAAHANWGGTWRMPTVDEIKELDEKCKWEWTTQNGVNGQKVTGPNGNSIFLPAAGFRNGSRLFNAGHYGDYWSSSLNMSCSSYAYYVNFDSSNVDWYYNYDRHNGRNVRAVCP